MNVVAARVRLFRHLALTPYVWFQVGICLLATYFSLAGEGWTRWGYPLFLAIILLSTAVEWENYLVIGMTRSHWRRHRRILTSAIAMLILLELLLLLTFTDLPVNPLLPVVLFTAWIWAMVRRSEPARSPAEPVRPGKSVDNTGRSRFPMTPVQQIIRGPQAMMWVLVWGLALFAVGLLSWVVGEPPTWIVAVLPLIVLPGTRLLMGRIGRSLREWVACGGARRVWAHETAVLGLLSPMFVGVITVIMVGVFSTSVEMGVVLTGLGVASLVPIFFIALELTELPRTWWLPLIHLCLAGGSVALLLTGAVGAGGFLAGCVLHYLLHALTLPAVARNSTVFGGGLDAWLGLRVATTA